MVIAKTVRAAQQFVVRHAALMVVAGFLIAGAASLVSGAEVSAACDMTNPSVSTGAECARGNGQPAQLVGDGGVFNRITSILLFIVGARSFVTCIAHHLPLAIACIIFSLAILSASSFDLPLVVTS